MQALNDYEIIEQIAKIKNGTIARISYKKEVPVKAEYKKLGYAVTKYVETSVRVGVNYHNIASVIARKAKEVITNTSKKSNYQWVIKNKVKYNTATEKNYVVVAILPNHANTKEKYVIELPSEAIVDSKIVPSDINEIILPSYFTKANEYREIKCIAFENIFAINNYGQKFFE